MAASARPAQLDATPVEALSGVGTAMAGVLAKLHIHSVQDVLFHLPARYLDRTHILPIADALPNQYVVVQGTVQRCQVSIGKRRSLLVVLADDSGQISLRFYHFSAAQKTQLEVGSALRCYGEARQGATGLELYHPEYDLLEDPLAVPPAQNLTPIYPLTEGLTQGRLRKLTAQAVSLMQDNPPAELMPAEVNDQFGGHSLADALSYAHFPPASARIEQLAAGRHPCQLRLVFEELLAHHFALIRNRTLAQQEQAPCLIPDQQLVQRFYGALPFAPTPAQQRVAAEINADLRQGRPMLRLVQGDVGSGKTLVAALAALAALGRGYQVAVAAPTEILAEQHRDNFSRWLCPLGFEVGWLVGKLTSRQKQETLARLADGRAQVAIGTHALFQDEVAFAKLGLVIIDEQHRFGVHQRLSLRQKAAGALKPHQLVMTATPIPRTLAMTYYADLDVSVIDQLPPGRQPVNTVLVSQARRAEVVERVRRACESGAQAYWVCTLVEDSETLSARAAEATLTDLQAALPHLNIGLVHGRMKSQDKEATMAAFKAGELHLLVATTVIEVGVDVPNASLMIIENPERLGLAQLHQLRGRVGRGEAASHCVLLFGNPLSQVARQRLSVLRNCSDGFVIAEEDLRIRGPGELLGARQTGLQRLRLADLERDDHLLPQVQKVAGQLNAVNPALADRLIHRWFPQQLDYLKG